MKTAWANTYNTKALSKLAQTYVRVDKEFN